MAEKRVSVRLAAVGGRQVRAEHEGVGEAGAKGFGRLSREMDAANQRLAAFSRRTKIAVTAATALGSASLDQDIAAIEAKTAQIVERLVATDNPTLIATYESQFVEFEAEKVALNARKAQTGQPQNTFKAISRTALTFVSNPWKLWASGSLTHQRAVLKPAFTKPLRYCRNEGFRTADLSLPFRLLEDSKTGEKRVVGGTGLEPVTPAM